MEQVLTEGLHLKILFVSNFYPPHHIGGYELGCRDIVFGLSALGHDVSVLTSFFGTTPRRDGSVCRWLSARTERGQYDPKGTGFLFLEEIRNHRAFQRMLSHVRPDLIYIWNLGCTSVTIAHAAEASGVPTVYFISDNWLEWWDSDSWFRFWSRSSRSFAQVMQCRMMLGLARAAGVCLYNSQPQARAVHFASDFLRRMTLSRMPQIEYSQVVPWGVDTTLFGQKQAYSTIPSQLLYVGRLVADKGPHVLLAALKLLLDQAEMPPFCLTLAGGSQDSNYLNHLRNLVGNLGLSDRVVFRGLLPREELSQTYQDHDILLFPSIWEEPFSITLLEAMASGLAIISTETGGTAEILCDGENALIMPPNDPAACADRIARLLCAPDLCRSLGESAARTVQERYTLSKMVSSINDSFRHVLGQFSRLPELANG